MKYMPRSFKIFHPYCYYILCNRALSISHDKIIQILTGTFYYSVMDAFNKLAATVTVSKQSQDPSSTQVDQGKSDPRPGPSSAPSPPRPRYQHQVHY